MFSCPDLAIIIKELDRGGTMTDKDINDLLDAIDVDGEGAIHYEVFCEWIFRPPESQQSLQTLAAAKSSQEGVASRDNSLANSRAIVAEHLQQDLLLTHGSSWGGLSSEANDEDEDHLTWTCPFPILVIHPRCCLWHLPVTVTLQGSCRRGGIKHQENYLKFLRHQVLRRRFTHHPKVRIALHWHSRKSFPGLARNSQSVRQLRCCQNVLLVLSRSALQSPRTQQVVVLWMQLLALVCSTLARLPQTAPLH